jgi:hypothetical protein
MKQILEKYVQTLVVLLGISVPHIPRVLTEMVELLHKGALQLMKKTVSRIAMYIGLISIIVQ